jgi:hypothetical protein
MLRPEAHLDVVRQRHSDLLREARGGELAARRGGSRRRERRAFVSRLRSRPGSRPGVNRSAAG